MTKITIDLDDYSKEDQEKIITILDNGKENSEDPIWVPKLHTDEYYFVTKAFSINCFLFNRTFLTDIRMAKHGNVFKTQEAAQRMADRRKRIGIFENKMMEFADGYEYDLGGSNCFVTYENGVRVKQWICDKNRQLIDPLTIYMTKENAEKAVEWANKHYPEGVVK